MACLRFITLFAVALGASSCSFLLDFDELQKGAAPGSGGNGGSGGSAGAGGADAGGAGGTGGTAGEPGVPLDRVSTVVAEAVCDKLRTCAGLAALDIVLADEECTTVGTELIDNTLIATLEETGAAYDPAAVPACIDALDDLECDGIGLGLPEECKRIQAGLKGEGQECLRSLDCESGLYCTTGSCPGTCSVRLSQGAPCVTVDECATGLTCFEGVCEPLGGEGDECGGTVLPGCATGLFCVGADDATTMPGRCFPAASVFVLSEGQACSFADPPALCQAGLSCPLISLQPRCLPEAPSLGTCELALPDMCPEGEYCNGGTCAPLPGAGEPCATGLILKPPCQAYLRCVSGTCRRVGDIGNTCVVNAECYSGTCFDGECVAPRCQ